MPRFIECCLQNETAHVQGYEIKTLLNPEHVSTIVARDDKYDEKTGKPDVSCMITLITDRHGPLIVSGLTAAEFLKLCQGDD